MNLKVNIGRDVVIQNPIIAASGTFGFGREFGEYLDLDSLGAISSKGLTLKKNLGNKGIRIFETASGIMNSIGLQNPGIDYFIEKELPFLLSKKAVTIANLGGHSVNDYIQGAEKLNETDVKVIELNISCPNVKDGGMAFGTDLSKAKEVISKVRKITDKCLMIKLSPNVTNIAQFAKLAQDQGADSVSLVNTFNAMAIDIERKKAVFTNQTAGLSGPCIKPIALRMVYEVCNAVNIPVIGMGGISNYKDALEFIMAGACAVQVGTANFIDYNTMINIVNDIKQYMFDNNIEDINQLRKII